MRKHIVAVALMAAVVGWVAAPTFSGPAHAATRVQAAGQQSPAHLFDKTRFVVHMAIAIGVFHHWVWKPYKAGDFKDWQHHKAALVKAGAALLVTVHEVKVAYGIAKGSNSATLKAVVGLVNNIANSFTKIGTDLKKGIFKVGDVTAASGLVDSLTKKVGFSAP